MIRDYINEKRKVFEKADDVLLVSEREKSYIRNMPIIW